MRAMQMGKATYDAMEQETSILQETGGGMLQFPIVIRLKD